MAKRPKYILRVLPSSRAYPLHLLEKAWIVSSRRKAQISIEAHWIYEVFRQPKFVIRIELTFPLLNPPINA